MFILGKRIKKDKVTNVLNPYNNQIIENVSLSEEKDVDQAIEIAQKGFKILKEMSTK